MSTTEDRQESQVYELGYLILPSIPEENLSKAVSNIVSIVEKAGGTTLDSESPFLQELEYSMSKTISARKYVVDEAYIGWMKFELEPSAVEAVKVAVEKLEEILRVLLIKAPRETIFTFAKAREAREKAQMAAEMPAAIPETPAAAAPEIVVE